MKIIFNFVFSSSENVIFLVILMRFLPSNGSHFPSDLLFLSIISFGSSKSINALVILMLFSKFSWKYSFFIWFVTLRQYHSKSCISCSKSNFTTVFWVSSKSFLIVLQHVWSYPGGSPDFRELFSSHIEAPLNFFEKNFLTSKLLVTSCFSRWGL